MSCTRRFHGHGVMTTSAYLLLFLARRTCTKVARLFAGVHAHAFLRGRVRDLWPLRGCPTRPRVGSVTSSRGLRHVGLIKPGTGGPYAAHSRQDPHAVLGG